VLRLLGAKFVPPLAFRELVADMNFAADSGESWAKTLNFLPASYQLAAHELSRRTRVVPHGVYLMPDSSEYKKLCHTHLTLPCPFPYPFLHTPFPPISDHTKFETFSTATYIIANSPKSFRPSSAQNCCQIPAELHQNSN